MNERQPEVSRTLAMSLVGGAGIILGLFVFGLFRWDEAPFAVLGLLMGGFFWALLLFGWFGTLPLMQHQVGQLATAPMWLRLMAGIMGVSALAVGVVAFVDGAEILAAAVWIILGSAGLLMVWMAYAIAFAMVLFAMRMSVLFVVALAGILGVIGLVRGDEPIASIAILVICASILLLGLLPWWLGVRTVQLPNMLAMRFAVFLPLFALIAMIGLLLIGGLPDTGTVDTDRSNVVALPETVTPSTSSTLKVDSEPDVVKPTTSPEWTSPSDVLGDALFVTPPSSFPLDQTQIRSGPNALANDPHLRSDSLTVGVVELTAEQIEALPERYGTGAPGRYTVIVAKPLGAATPGVEYQLGGFFGPSPAYSAPEDGQIGFGDSLTDVSVRAFLNETTGEVEVFDASFEPIDRNVFFVMGPDQTAMFVGEDVMPNGGFGWYSSFGREAPATEASPAGWVAAGPVQLGGSTAAHAWEVTSDDPAIGCETSGDTAWCYDSSEIRDIFRLGKGCDNNPDTVVVVRDPGPNSETKAPGATIEVTHGGAAGTAAVQPSAWRTSPDFVEGLTVQGRSFGCEIMR